MHLHDSPLYFVSICLKYFEHINRKHVTFTEILTVLFFWVFIYLRLEFCCRICLHIAMKWYINIYLYSSIWLYLCGWKCALVKGMKEHIKDVQTAIACLSGKSKHIYHPLIRCNTFNSFHFTLVNDSLLSLLSVYFVAVNFLLLLIQLLLQTFSESNEIDAFWYSSLPVRLDE